MLRSSLTSHNADQCTRRARPQRYAHLARAQSDNPTVFRSLRTHEFIAPVATFANQAQSSCTMYPRFLHWLLIASLLLNAIVAPWAMAAVSHNMGHTTSHGEHAAIADPSQQGHDHHDMHHSQMTAELRSTDDTTAAPPENAGACCNGTICQCGCVLPPALLFALSPPIPQFVARMPAAASVHRSQVLPSTPPFRPPTV